MDEHEVNVERMLLTYAPASSVYKSKDSKIKTGWSVLTTSGSSSGMVI
jgi:hypothetical protein